MALGFHVMRCNQPGTDQNNQQPQQQPVAGVGACESLKPNVLNTLPLNPAVAHTGVQLKVRP